MGASPAGIWRAPAARVSCAARGHCGPRTRTARAPGVVLASPAPPAGISLPGHGTEGPSSHRRTPPLAWGLTVLCIRDRRVKPRNVVLACMEASSIEMLVEAEVLEFPLLVFGLPVSPGTQYVILLITKQFINNKKSIALLS